MRSKEAQAIYNSRRWKQLRADYLADHPLCELCLQEGRATSAIDLHHKIPFATATTRQEMERLAYDRNNLQALCIPHHVQVHKDMGRATKDNHAERANQALQRWIERQKKHA